MHIEACCGHLMSATVQEGRVTVRQQTVEPLERKLNYKDELDIRQKRILKAEQQN